MDLTSHKTTQRKFTFDNDDIYSVSRNSTIRVTNQGLSARPELISERYARVGYFHGTFIEQNFTVIRKFIVNQKTGYRLHYSTFVPNEPTVANVIFVHGWLPSIYFFDLAEQFAKQGFTVHLFDLSGFGFSEGYARNETLDVFVSDLTTIIDAVGFQKPLFLYGHSIGALVILLLATLNPTAPFDGLMVSSPLIDIPAFRRIHWLKNLLFSKVFSKIFEQIGINLFMNPTAMTKDNNYLKSICESNSFNDLGFDNKNPSCSFHC